MEDKRYAKTKLKIKATQKIKGDKKVRKNPRPL